MSAQYTESELNAFRQIAEYNNNYRLYRLKKADQIKICIHYGISQTGTKAILEKRIIEHRDSQMVYSEYTDREKKNIYFRYNIYGSIIYYESEPEKRKHLNRECRINLIILHHKLSIMHNPNIDIQLENMYNSNDTRYEIIDKIIYLFFILGNSRSNLATPKKNIKIQNLLNETINVYWTDKRDDNLDYSVCKKLSSIMSGYTQGINYNKSTTSVIISKIDLHECYYMDIKDQIILEKNFGDANGRIEVRENKQELEQWKEATLKCDYLIKQLKRLGVDKNENYAMIIDMHQDIVIPQHSERDKEVAGIPSALTNVT